MVHCNVKDCSLPGLCSTIPKPLTKAERVHVSLPTMVKCYQGTSANLEPRICSPAGGAGRAECSITALPINTAFQKASGAIQHFQQI